MSTDKYPKRYKWYFELRNYDDMDVVHICKFIEYKCSIGSYSHRVNNVTTVPYLDCSISLHSAVDCAELVSLLESYRIPRKIIVLRT